MSMQRSAVSSTPVVLDRRTVLVRALTYNVPDTYGTSWKPGCATLALERGKPIVCWSHDRTRIVGAVTGFQDYPGHLDMTVRLADPDRVPDVRMVQALLEPDVLPGLGVSIGFSDALAEPDPLHRGVKRIISARIGELSFVGCPSVPGARVLSVRSQEVIRAAQQAPRSVPLPRTVVTDAAIAQARLRLASIAAGGSGRDPLVMKLRLVAAERAQAARKRKIKRGEAWGKSFDALDWQQVVDAGPVLVQARSVAPTQIPGMPNMDQDPWLQRTAPASPTPMSLPPQDLIDAGVASGLSASEAIAAWERTRD